MRAAICHSFGAPLEIGEVELAAPEAEEVEVEIRACAICHSDLTFASGGWGGELPAVYGHEAAGVVRRAGPASGFEAGQRVLATMVRSCGACPCCSAGYDGACTAPPRRAGPALRGADGRPIVQGLGTAAFAERALVHRSQCVALPDDLPFEQASLLACGVITGWGAVANTAAVPEGASVAVIGCGGVGINCIQGARLRGAARIVAIDPSPARLDQARRFGATDAAAPAGAEEAVRELTGGRGVDYAFVAAGVRPAIEQAFRLLAPMGAAVLVGIPPSGVMAEFDPVTFACAPHRLLGSKLHARLERDVPALIDHWRAGRLELDGLITARVPFARINEALDLARAGTGLRNVVTFGEAA